jgi:hypothetical protein
VGDTPRALVGQLREAEIRELRVAAAGEENVRRLDIAVQNVGPVRGRQAVCNTDQQFHALPPTVLQRAHSPIGKRAAVDELGDEVLAAVELACVVHRKNVWMVERRRHSSFLLKPPPGVGVEQVLGKELDRHGPIEIQVGAAADDAHAAGGNDAVDAVMADRRADSDSRRRLGHGGCFGAGESLLDGLPQLGVARRAVGHEREALGGQAGERLAIQAFDLLLPLEEHRDYAAADVVCFRPVRGVPAARPARVASRR